MVAHPNRMATYQKVIIYYFSGTGNSKNVASWFAKVAIENDIECETINIAHIDRLSIDPPDSNALIGFVSPIHGFNYPPVMLNFIMRFPKGKNKVILMNTRAGMLLGNCITPGLTGIAFYLAALILKIKGFSIKAMYPVNLPSNWISVHPGLNERTVKYLHVKNKERVYEFAQKVLAGKSDYRGIYEVIQDALISPVSILYYFIGRFVFAKTYYASSDCNKCGICIKGCPVHAILKIDNRPFWTFNCESCMKCMSTCPEKAIETAHGSFIGFSLIFYSVILALFYKYFILWFFPIENNLVRVLIESLIFIPLFGVWYMLTHYLLRFKWFERFVVYTSLTKYKFWGRRYKALK